MASKKVTSLLAKKQKVQDKISALITTGTSLKAELADIETQLTAEKDLLLAEVAEINGDVEIVEDTTSEDVNTESEGEVA